MTYGISCSGTVVSSHSGRSALRHIILLPQKDDDGQNCSEMAGNIFWRKVCTMLCFGWLWKLAWFRINGWF